MKKIELKEAAQLIRDDQIIALHQGSEYTLICSGKSDEAVSSLRKLKHRSPSKGFTILVDSDARINRHVKDIPELAWDILDTTDGNLILVLEGGQNLSKNALAQDGTVAIRKVIDENELNLVRMASVPLVATQARTSENEADSNTAIKNPNLLNEVEYLLTLPPVSGRENLKTYSVIFLGSDNQIRILRK